MATDKKLDRTRVTDEISEPIHQISFIRERLVDRTLLILVCLGTPVVTASMFRILDVGWHSILVSHLVTYIVYLLLFFSRRRIPYSLKAVMILLSGLIAGVGGLLSFGIIGGALLAFTAVTTLSTIFFGIWAGAVLALSTFIAGAVVGILVNTRHITFPYDVSAYALSPNAWITVMAAYGVLAAIVIGNISMMLSYLKQNIVSLGKRAESLSEANQALKKEVQHKEEAWNALQISENKYRGILESIGDGTYEVDLEGRIIFFNRAMLEIFGYQEHEFMGLEYKKHVAEEDIARVYKEFNDVFRHGRPNRITRYGMVRKDGARRVLETSIYPVMDYEGKAVSFRGVVRDVTSHSEMEKHKEKLERQMQEGQKWQAIGTLAGGVAHDFNNLLMGIQGNTSLLLMSKKDQDPDRERLESIETCVRDATRLTSQLLAYARGGKYEVKTTDINRLVTKTATMFGRTRKEIRLFLDLKNTLYVDVDRGQIQQVLLNLLVNSWQAMPSGGDIFITTENENLYDLSSVPEWAKLGPYVRLSVRDSGLGMDEETIRRAFEPFFTTKDKGRGTGLGLSSAYGIVRNHGGFINLKSELGHGSIVDLFLPAVNANPEEEEEPGSFTSVCGAATVLLVDDEPVVLNTTSQMLEALGYKVLSAESGEKAVKFASEYQDKIDLMILDMIMPGMGGEEVFHKVRKIRPELKVLLSSGYSLDGKAAELFEQGCCGFLQKPYTLGELTRKVQEILNCDPFPLPQN